MKRIHIWRLVVSISIITGACNQGTQVSDGDEIFEIDVVNNGPTTVLEYGLDIDLVRVNGPFVLFDGSEELPVQIEDRNNNGTPDKMFALVQIPRVTTKKLIAMEGPPADPSLKTTVHAHLNSGDKVEGTYLYKDGEKWAGHGIILENEIVGYRWLMKPPFAFDIIGKSKSDFLTSPVTETIDKTTSWGGDILNERLSLGLGTPAIFDQSQIVYLSQCESREVTILADGPLRSEVQMTVKGIPVRDEKIDVQIHLQLWAGKPWAQVDLLLLSKTDLTLQFAFGLPKHEEATDFTQALEGNVHFAYTYGLQSADGDHLGLAVMAKQGYELDTYREDPHNYFYLATPKNRSVQYRILSAWVRNQEPIYDEVDFVEFIKKHSEEYGAGIQVKPVFKLD